jgi:UDP-2-acetamido-3-amino-2,3-dideoxy-glucuronate N-acetyltransferase
MRDSIVWPYPKRWGEAIASPARGEAAAANSPNERIRTTAGVHDCRCLCDNVASERGVADRDWCEEKARRGMTGKVAVIGAGHWGRNHVRNFAELGVLAAVVDANAAVASELAEKHGAEPLTAEAAFARADISGIVIATPAETHAGLALAAFAAGKHVFVEKPLALTMADGRAMTQAAHKANRVLMVDHLLRHHPAFERLLALVRAGTLGRLRSVTSHRLSLGKLRTEENALWSFAVHDVSMLLALFGAAPVSAEVRGGAFVTPGIEDENRLDLVFPGGARGHVHASWLHPFKEHRLVVVGSEAMAVFEDSAPDPAQRLRLYRHRIVDGPHGPQAEKAEAEQIAFEADEPLKRACRRFLAAMNGADPITDGEEALAVLDVLTSAQAHSSAQEAAA